MVNPRPKDVEAFEKVYQDEHVPMAVAKLGGKTKIVATRILTSPQGLPPFYRIAEIHFSSMEALQACADSEGGQQTLAHAVSIFFRRCADFPGGRGRDLRIQRASEALDLRPFGAERVLTSNWRICLGSR